MKVLLSLLAIVALVSGQTCSSIYGQCGGKGWSGPTCCAAGTQCTVSNEWYSQCLPAPSTGATTGPSTGNPTTGATTGPSTGKPTTGNPTSGPSTSAGGSGTGSTGGNPTTGGGSTTGGQTNNPTNPYTGYEVFPSPFYAQEALAASKMISDPVNAGKALAVANIPSFTWLDTLSKIPVLEQLLNKAQGLQNSTGKKQIVQIVVYDLPNRDCAAKASNGEFQIAQDGINKYKAYIDRISGTVRRYKDIRVVAIVEPDSLANLVTNLNMPTCAAAAEAYKTCTAYAIQQLSKAQVVQYLDAGHGGWLGWEPNLAPAAKVFGDVLRSAGAGHTVRGLVTNVANYNPLTIATPEPFTQGNKNYDELHYIQALAPLLTAQNFPAHFIVDQGRSGQTGIRNQWGDWCNIKGAGFGRRPTSKTGYDILDAIVWTKPGGESDGTSNSQSPRFDSTCSLSDSLQPAPEAGTWFQAYFEQLIVRANPPI